MARRLGQVALTAPVAALILSAVAAGSGATPDRARAMPRPVAFVLLGNFPRAEAGALARHFAATLGLETRVLGRADTPASAFNRKRKQYVAQELIDVVASRRTAAGGRDVLIGLTTRDMHTRDIPSWRFSFSIRHPSGLAVVSRARMDPRLLGLAPDPALRTRRLRKMVLKNIGLLALGLAESKNPRSALYDVILSTDDLDFMTEEFRPHPPTGARRSWLEAVDGACERGIVEAKALVARSPLTTPAQVLAYVREGIVLEDRTRDRLASTPAAAEDRAAVGISSLSSSAASRQTGRPSRS